MWQARVESLPVPPLPPWRCLHSWTGCLRKRNSLIVCDSREALGPERQLWKPYDEALRLRADLVWQRLVWRTGWLILVCSTPLWVHSTWRCFLWWPTVLAFHCHVSMHSQDLVCDGAVDPTPLWTFLESGRRGMPRFQMSVQRWTSLSIL